MPDGFDENIIGMNVGETKTFTFEGPGIDDDGNEIVETIECTVTVKEIQKKVVPAIDDAWVAKYMPMYKDAAALRGRHPLRPEPPAVGAAVRGLQAPTWPPASWPSASRASIADEVYEAMSRRTS